MEDNIKEVLKDFFDAGYDYRTSLLPEIIEEYGENSCRDFTETLSDFEKEDIISQRISNLQQANAYHKELADSAQQEQWRLKKEVMDLKDQVEFLRGELSKPRDNSPF